MAKNLKSCISAMEKLAKSGEVEGRYSVHADEVKTLEEMGFEVSLPKNYREDKWSRKNAWEVTISWENPTDASVASHFNKLVWKHRYDSAKLARATRNCLNRQGKVAQFALVDVEWHDEQDQAENEDYGDYSDDNAAYDDSECYGA